ncbi:MAG: lipopolysaccharide biosynthesis protein [Bacillota bacterium]
MSKTKLGIKTAISVMLVALIQGALSIYRTSVVLGAYGDNINGVVQVALQVSAYLVLFQNGMSAAFQYKMYAPLTRGEFGRISGLFSGLQRKMLGLSGKMLLIAVVVIPVYSALLIKQGVGYWDTVLILAAIGIRITAPYFVTLPERCLIDIREKRYVVNIVEGVKDCVTLAAEILLIRFTPLPLPLILCVNLIFLAASKQVYLLLVRKYYGKAFSLKSPPEYAPLSMTKAVYAHQVSSIATSNTDNVVLSLMSSLTNVTIYSAYATLISYPSLVINRIIEGMRASLALKITRGDDDSYNAYKELLAFSFFCAGIVVPVFLQMANPFVALWIGPQYRIHLVPLLLFGLILADSFIMPPVYAARDARGLYQESKGYTIAQAIVNVVVSVGLVIPFGITGVLAGTFAALYLILQPRNFILVYTKVFERKVTIYYDLIVVAALCAASYFVSGLVMAAVFPAGISGWMVLIEKTSVCTATALVITAAGLWVSNSGFRSFVKRFSGIIRRKRTFNPCNEE